MARRKGTGSITRLDKAPKSRCRHWKLRYRVGGKERSRRFKGTYTQAEDALAALAEEAEAETRDAEDRPITFAEYADRWQARREASGEIRKSTAMKDALRINVLRSQFGGMLLRDIGRAEVVDGMSAIKGGSGKQLMGSTMRGYHTTMSQIMQEAVLDGIIGSNPVKTVRTPKIDTPSRKALTADEFRRVADGLDSMPLDGRTMGIRLMMMAGLRSSEAMAIDWAHVGKSSMSIAASVSCKTGEIAPTKTESGLRDVPLMPQLSDAMSRWRDEQATELRALGMEQRPDTPILTSPAGERLEAKTVYRWWRYNSKRLFGVECTLHELRHTFLTLLGNATGNMQVVKSVAGWASISMADIYVHSDSDANAEAVSVLGRKMAVGGEGVPKRVPTSLADSTISF